MEITGFETFRVQPRWLFLKVTTDAEITGWGEPNLEGHTDAVLGALSNLEEYFVGEDPTRIEHHWQTVYRGSFYHRGEVLNSALAGVNQALWDIRGKDLGVPIYELLGGPTRDEVRAYAPVVGEDSPERLDGPPSLLADRAAERVEAGYDAIKMIPFAETQHVDKPSVIDGITDAVRSVRERVGPDVDIALDAHGKFSPAMARRVIDAVEPYDPLFVEEPVKPEYDHRLGELRQNTTVPLATGERRYSKWDFREIADSGVDIFQPDPSHAGGISELRRIATLAETHGIAMAPHCPLGPVALAAAVHVDAAIPNLLIQETPGFYGGRFDQYLESGLEIVDGAVQLPEDSGLGVTVDEDALRDPANQGHDQYIPTRYHDDGSVADW